MRRLILSRLAAIAACVCAPVASALAQDATGPAAPTIADPRFAHLATKPGGPGWSVGSIAASLPAGKPPMFVEPTKSVPPVTDAEAALKAAVAFLAAADRPSHEAAYRVAGATLNATKHPLAAKLFALLQYHGIGTRADAKLSVRTVLPLVRAGDVEACEFAAATDAETFAESAVRATSIRKLLATKTPGAFRVVAPIAVVSGDDKVTLRGDADLVVTLDHGLDRIQKGRVMQVAGLFGVDGTLRALVAEVPEPVFDFKWKLARQAERRGYRLSSVSVTVRNTGVQHVKDMNFKVRCWNRTDGYTRTAEIGELAPGKSRTVEVSFGMYDWYWGVNAGDPKAEVTVDEVKW